MEMTFSILMALMQRLNVCELLQVDEHASDGRHVGRLRCLSGGTPSSDNLILKGDPDTLYLRDAETEDLVELCFSDSDGGAPSVPCCLAKGTGGSWQIMEALMDAWQEWSLWENRLAGLILHRAPLDELLMHGKVYLPYEYTLIDRDMNVMFSTPDYHTDLAPDENNSPDGARRLSAELTHSLLMRKDFHEAALKKEAFYFYDYYSETALYCRNIFLYGQYFARLICRLPQEQEIVSEGVGQIFELFARYIELYFQNDLQNPNRHQNDLLHQLSRSLYAGEQTDAAQLQMALTPYRWLPNHRYRAAILTAYRQGEWETQVEIALPFLIRELERQWQNTCAVSLGDKILWLVNLSLTEQTDFFSRFSVFIRENVCRAGFSGIFSDLSMIRGAAMEAEAALRLGIRSDSTFWYYQFEDYRLDYCLEALQRELPPERLLHPAVKMLRERDAEKGSELLATLRAYLDCGMNMTRAADQLYIHRTTFCRRMDQILRLTGISDASSDLMLDILLSLKLLEADKE